MVFALDWLTGGGASKAAEETIVGNLIDDGIPSVLDTVTDGRLRELLGGLDENTARKVLDAMRAGSTDATQLAREFGDDPIFQTLLMNPDFLGVVQAANAAQTNLENAGDWVQENILDPTATNLENLPENMGVSQAANAVQTNLENAGDWIQENTPAGQLSSWIAGGGLSDLASSLSGVGPGGGSSDQMEWNQNLIDTYIQPGAEQARRDVMAAIPGSAIPEQTRLYQSAADTLRGATPQVQQLLREGGEEAIRDLQGGGAGAESAFTDAQRYAIQDLTGGYGQARADVVNQGQRGIDEFRQALAGSQALGREGLGYLSGAAGAARGQIGAGIQDLQASETRGLDRLKAAVDQGVSTLQPFVAPGQQAQQRQAALSGALGAEAQQQAFNEFTQSPGQKFIQDRQQQALLRNAQALGGLGGGRVRTALQEQAAGFAAQDYDNAFNRLGALTGQGLQAAGQIGQLRGQQGTSSANLIGQMGQARGQLRGQGAQIESTLGQTGANLLGQMAGDYLGGGETLLGARQDIGRSLADLETGRAGATAGVRTGMGELIGGTRFSTGQGVAGIRDALGGNLANVLSGQATGVAGLQAGLGDARAGQYGDLSQLLAGIGTGVGQTAAGLPSVTGQQSNRLQQIGQLAGGIGGLFSGLFGG